MFLVHDALISGRMNEQSIDRWMLQQKVIWSEDVVFEAIKQQMIKTILMFVVNHVKHSQIDL